MDVVKELELYLSKNALETLLETMMTECLRHKPEEPSHYLLKWLIDQNASKGSEEVAIASSSDKQHVAITHPDQATQQYLKDKKLHIIFLELMKLVVKEKPDNVLSFLALEAHQMHKVPPPSLQPP
ncbi:hypothetical protein DUNSADRAFT_2620 [Dunaliella salina]|uniref:Uncharacterized protein n=1 Tax=Dunaliella salina TaxID=3046 RepID=A0ABQ7GVD4_DUNSA|nr:hypothetical protein DUNSADRAFT_2620 [Dunaliella salina]|eukprot:KAF5838559.1 hypothetical protein DUNSADRAFT_2620 [Dunaliella salina]